jgi:hypothetical protein
METRDLGSYRMTLYWFIAAGGPNTISEKQGNKGTHTPDLPDTRPNDAFCELCEAV